MSNKKLPENATKVEGAELAHNSMHIATQRRCLT